MDINKQKITLTSFIPKTTVVNISVASSLLVALGWCSSTPEWKSNYFDSRYLWSDQQAVVDWDTLHIDTCSYDLIIDDYRIHSL